MTSDADAGRGSALRRERERRGWSQDHVARQLGAPSRFQVSRWERGLVVPSPHYRERYCRLFGMDAIDLGFVGQAEGIARDLEAAPAPADNLLARGPLPDGSRMPMAPNPLFAGRGEELLEIAAALTGGESTGPDSVVAVTGLGGLGKTQLAVEFVHRYGRLFTGGVFWLSFASADEVPLQVAACAGAGAMDLAPGIESRPVGERVQRVCRAWQSDASRLLVFDNCEDEAVLDAWRPATGGCRVLVTSRRSHWSPTLGVTVLPLDVLPRADSVELLRGYRPDLASHDSRLDAIARELGDLPLALHLAGSYLRAYREEVSLGDYLAELRRSEVVRHASLLGAGLDDSVSPTRHVQDVAQTFALCLDRLAPEREIDRVAIALLARMAWLAPGTPAPRDLLAMTLPYVNRLALADGLRRLAAVGLVDGGERWPRMHRLVGRFVRLERLDPDAEGAVADALIECGAAAEQGAVAGLALAALIPHVVHAASEHGAGETRQALLDGAAGLALSNAGDLRAAQPWLARAAATMERTRGPDDPATARALNGLAPLLRLQGIWLVVWLIFHTPLVLVFGAWNDWGIALAVCLASVFLSALAANGRSGRRVTG